MLKPNTLGMTFVLALLTALGPLATDMYLPALPTITSDLITETARTQLTLSVFLIGIAVGQFIYGPVSDQLGRKPLLLFGLVLFFASSIVCSQARSIEALIVARFFQALGASGPAVVARAMVRDLYEGPRAGRELSRMASIMGLVPALAPILGGITLTMTSWRFIFGIGAAGSFCLAAAVAFLTPETRPRQSGAKITFGSVLTSFGILLRDRGYRFYVGMSTIAFTGLFAFISGSSFVLQDVYGLTPIEFSLSFALAVAGFIGGTVLSQYIIGKHGILGTIALGVRLLALGGLAMPLLVMSGWTSSLAITGPMLIYQIGVGMTMPQSMAGAMAPFPERAGAASSLLGMIQTTFAAIAGAGLGLIVSSGRMPLPIVIAITGALAVILFYVAHPSTSKKGATS